MLLTRGPASRVGRCANMGVAAGGAKFYKAEFGDEPAPQTT